MAVIVVISAQHRALGRPAQGLDAPCDDIFVARLDPTNRLLAVIDRVADAEGVVRDLAATGVAAVEILSGSADAERIDPSGRTGGHWLRIKRAVALGAADQSVDLALYEAALRNGRAVLVVRASGEQRDAVTDVLRDAGAHFVNYYGRWVTEEIIPWRGERLPLPQFLQR